MNIEFKGIGTTWYVEIFDQVDVIFGEQIKQMVADFELKYSRFISTSEVSILNTRKYLENPSADFIEMLKLGEKAKEITSGAFDITVGGILEDLGYDSNYSHIPKEDKKYITGNIKYIKNKIEIAENVKIDLGGVGKGYLVDKVKNFLLENNVKYFLINAGGDIYVTSDNENEIEFGLESPFDTNQIVGTVKIKNKSIASSSNSKRKWVYKNKEYHHIVNLNNIPEKEVKAVFTMGEKCTDTDTASTCLFLTNANLHEKKSKFYQIEYMIVYADGTFMKSTNYPVKLFEI